MSTIECALFGTLGRDAESKVSKAGKTYLRLALRVGDGDVGQWVSAMVFDPDAIASADKMVKGARVYLEGRLSLDKWIGQDGAERHGLSVMAGHCRLAQIGRNKPLRERAEPRNNPAESAGESRAGSDLNDDLTF